MGDPKQQEQADRRAARDAGNASIAATSPPHMDGEALPPRLRRALERLLAGDSEKQGARALGISPHTFHEYVMNLYRHFGVCSRAELMAKWVRLRDA